MLTLQRFARAAATSAAGAASRQRPLSAATAAAAAMPSNVTASVPRSGPLQLPPGAPVWKRKPGAPTQVLYERTPKEMLKNLQYLAASPHGASRPAPLHRLLERVQTRADLDLAIRGLNTLSNSKTELNRGTTARLLAEAAIRAGAPEVAVETFTKWKSSGLRPGKQALAALFTAVQAPAQRELLSSTINCMWAAGPAFDGTPIDPSLASCIVTAYTRVGDLENAVRMYIRVRNRLPDESGWGGNDIPAIAILSAAQKAVVVAKPKSGEHSSSDGALALAPAVAALIRKTVLVDAMGSGAAPPKRFAFTAAGGPGGSGGVLRSRLASVAAEAHAALPPLREPAAAAAAATEAGASDGGAPAAAPSSSEAGAPGPA